MPAPAPPPPTIITLKTTFLTSQTRVLSSPLQPTRAWQSSNEELPEKQVNDALSKLNHRIQQHSKRVYAPQATRHVAEQIEVLYTSSHHRPDPNRSLGDDDDDDDAEQGVSTAADLADAGMVGKLPDQWPNGQEGEQDRRKYEELVRQLKRLDQQKKKAEGRLARLKGLKRLLEPFEEVEVHVQGNLVARNGEVEQELERMRMLLARVGGRVAGLKRRQGEEEDGEEMEIDGVEGVLGRF